MKRKIVLSLILVALITYTGSAQDASLGLYFNQSKPLAEFADNLDKNPAGLVIKGNKMLGETNLAIGAELGISMYSNQKYRVEMEPGVLVDVREEDCYYHGNVTLQYFFIRESLISPYVAGKVGFSTFFSDVYPEDYDEDFEGMSKTHGTSFNTGMAAGFLVNMNKLVGKPRTNPVYFDFSVSRMTGTKSKYRHIKNNETVNYDLNYGKYESFTDHLDFQFGVVFTL